MGDCGGGWRGAARRPRRARRCRGEIGDEAPIVGAVWFKASQEADQEPESGDRRADREVHEEEESEEAFLSAHRNRTSRAEVELTLKAANGGLRLRGFGELRAQQGGGFVAEFLHLHERGLSLSVRRRIVELRLDSFEALEQLLVLLLTVFGWHGCLAFPSDGR